MPQPPPIPRTLGAEGGMTLIEVALALLVVAVATMASVSWTLSGMSLNESNRQTADAQEVLRGVLEELQEISFREIFPAFNEDADDDPGGIGTASGPEFTVDLSAKGAFLPLNDGTGKTAPPGPVSFRRRPFDVRITFPVNAAGKLSETAQDDFGGGVFDLDGDGMTESTDCGATYQMLPVRVRVAWENGQGSRSIEHVRLMTRRVRAGDVN